MPVANPSNTLPLVRRDDFGPDFLWGSSTSSYQIEGAAGLDGRGESIWDRFCATPGHIRDGSSGAVACDHYHRWPQDLDLARSMGTSAYRFSIAWPRIFANGSETTPNRAGLDFYDRLVDGMLARGLQPWATLYHWDLPQALQDGGGWAARSTVDAYLRYVDAVSRRLGDRVAHWITHNEPWCTAFLGHWEGNHAPGVKDLATALQVSHHVLLSHGRALPVLRANVPKAHCGITLSLHPLRAASDSAEDQAAMRRHDGLRNRWFLDPLHGRGYPSDVLALLGERAPKVERGDLDLIAGATDFLGVNYYFPELVAHDAAAAPLQARVVERAGVERTAFGWEVAPEGLVELLTRLQAEYHPKALYVTENGSTYDDPAPVNGRVPDRERLRYLVRHLDAARSCVRAGVALKGYFAWSLLDNFEWAEGYLRRFGLTYVDFDTQVRTLKDSGRWYQAFLQHTTATLTELEKTHG